MSARYAVYYVPEQGSHLDVLGCGLLGRNAAGADIPRLWVALPAPLRLENITTAPRHYGLHATLKAPFALARGCSLPQLREALRALAGEQAAFLLPPLEVGTVRQGDFLALRVAHSYAQEHAASGKGPCGSALHALEARCVCQLDHFRAPLSTEDMARRTGLSPRQQEHLYRWGYPHVLEDFHFHITLTDSMGDESLRRQTAEALRAVFAPVCAPHRILMRGLALVQQPDRQQPFRLVASFPFTPLDDQARN